MDSLPVNITDIAVGAVLLVSALLAYARGFVHESLSVGGWIGAIFATIYGFPLFKPLVRQYIASDLLADIIAGVVIFVTALVVLSILTSAIARRVKASALNALDRALGFLFGVLRGAVLVCVAYLLVGWMLPESEHPTWIREAKTLPYVQRGTILLEGLLPAEARRSGERAVKTGEDKARKMLESQKLLRDMVAPAPKLEKRDAPEGYVGGARRDMERLIESTR